MSATRRRFYPNRFDQTTWNARQSDIPSQHMAVSDPYDPSYQADIGSLYYDSQQEGIAGGGNTTDQGGPGGPGGGGAPGGPGAGSSGNAFVRYTFDSRPVLARDWVSQSYPNTLANSNDPQGTFTVPQGYIAIVREAFYLPNLIGITADIFGKPAGTLSGTLQVNGVPVANYNAFDMAPLYPGGGSFECFILLNQGDKIQGHTFFQGSDITGTLSASSGAWYFQGVLLPNDGRDLAQQVGNRDCEPVCLDPSTISQIKPPPLVVPGMPTPANPTGAIVISKPCCTKPPYVSVNDYLACITAGGAACP